VTGLLSFKFQKTKTGPPATPSIPPQERQQPEHRTSSRENLPTRTSVNDSMLHPQLHPQLSRLSSTDMNDIDEGNMAVERVNRIATQRPGNLFNLGQKDDHLPVQNFPPAVPVVTRTTGNVTSAAEHMEKAAASASNGTVESVGISSRPMVGESSVPDTSDGESMLSSHVASQILASNLNSHGEAASQRQPEAVALEISQVDDDK